MQHGALSLASCTSADHPPFRRAGPRVDGDGAAALATNCDIDAAECVHEYERARQNGSMARPVSGDMSRRPHAFAMCDVVTAASGARELASRAPALTAPCGLPNIQPYGCTS